MLGYYTWESTASSDFFEINWTNSLSHQIWSDRRRKDLKETI